MLMLELPSRLKNLTVVFVLAGFALGSHLARAQSAEGHPDWPFGKGRAIYVATPAQPQIMRPLYHQLCACLELVPGPKTPDNVYARAVNGRVLYVNTTNEPKDVPIEGAMSGVLTGRRWTGTLRLEPFGVDLLQK
jgi:beta-galactosidase GanA